MAAGQANRSYLSYVGFFRYFVLPHGDRAADDRPLALVARIDGEMKVLSFHSHPSKWKRPLTIGYAFTALAVWSQLLFPGLSRSGEGTRRQLSIRHQVAIVRAGNLARSVLPLPEFVSNCEQTTGIASAYI